MNVEARPGRDYSQKDSQTLKEEVGSTLRKLIKNNFPSYASYARCIGKPPQQLNSWQSGLGTLNPENMGLILSTLKPEGEELDQLIEPWRELVVRKDLKKAETAYERGRKLEKKSTTPIGRWIDKIIESQRVTLSELADRIGAYLPSLSAWRLGRASPDPESISSLLEYAEKSELPEELKEELRRAIVESIEERARKRIVIRTAGIRARTAKKSAPCRTYTGTEAGYELENITRERVRQIRGTLGITNLLITEVDLKRIREYQEAHKRGRPPKKVGQPLHLD